MDLGLAGMNGIEATIQVKEFNPDIKVIALTSHDREEEVIATLSSGAIAYCLKDIDPTKLADVIRDVAKGVCWLDPEVARKVLNAFPKQGPKFCHPVFCTGMFKAVLAARCTV